MPAVTPAVAGWIKEKTPTKRRRQLAEGRVRVRQVTSRARSLPDVLIVGAQRSGTSSLYKYLGAHPQVYPSLRKEVEYFSTRFDEGEGWYRAHFPLAATRALRSRRRSQPTLAFEATPDYLLHPSAAHRAAQLIPEAKIIALVRNPIDRAISQYGHNRRLDQEPLTLEAALASEDERLFGELEKISDDPRYDARPLRRYSYVTRGKYAEQLIRWQAWYPQDQIMVVRFEDLAADPAETLSAIESFLGIEDWHPPEFANHSYGRAGRADSPAVDDDIRHQLAATFRPHNEKLAALLGYDLQWPDAGGTT